MKPANAPIRRQSRAPFAMAFAALLGGCISKPPPGLIANCRASASVYTAPAAKVRSLLIATSGRGDLHATYAGLLESWRLDFIEFPARGEAGLVDRARLLPSGDARCAPVRQYYFSKVSVTRLPHALTAPRGSCVAVDLDQAPAAEMRISLTYTPASDHVAETYEAVRLSDGAVVGRVRDFAIRPIELSPVDCEGIVRGFPGNPLRVLLDHVAERR